jgi:hypothetical protein
MGKRANVGHKMAGLAAIVAIAGFFSPWILVSCNEQPLLRLHGDQLALGGSAATEVGDAMDDIPANPLLLVTLGAAVSAFLILVFVYSTGRMGELLGLCQLALGVLGSLAMSIVLSRLRQEWAVQGVGPASDSDLSIRLDWGFWITVAGLTGIIVGGVFNLVDLMRRGRSRPGTVDELTRLAGLYRSGALSDEEYAAAKKRIIAQK